MAIDTNDEKLALIYLGQVFHPNLPMAHDGSFSQGEKQQFLWGYPGVLWAAGAAMANAIFDLNTRIWQALNTYYGYGTNVDINEVFQRYLANVKTGDYTKRLTDLITDSTL